MTMTLTEHPVSADAGRTISDIQARLFRVPLGEAMGDAMHGLHTHFELVTVTIRTSDGMEGTGYTQRRGKGRAARPPLRGVHTPLELVPVTIRTSDGMEGTGYTYTGGKGGRAVLAMVNH